LPYPLEIINRKDTLTILRRNETHNLPL